MPDRPLPVGRYEVLQDFENTDLSIRIIEMDGEPERISRHVHHDCAQVYVVLEGDVEIDKAGAVLALGKYEIGVIPAGVAHGARPKDGRAVVINISVPPLAAADQVAVT